MQEGAPAPVGLVSSGNWGGGALLSFLEVDAPKPRPASGARGQRTWGGQGLGLEASCGEVGAACGGPRGVVNGPFVR